MFVYLCSQNKIIMAFQKLRKQKASGFTCLFGGASWKCIKGIQQRSNFHISFRQLPASINGKTAYTAHILGWNSKPRQASCHTRMDARNTKPPQGTAAIAFAKCLQEWSSLWAPGTAWEVPVCLVHIISCAPPTAGGSGSTSGTRPEVTQSHMIQS